MRIFSGKRIKSWPSLIIKLSLIIFSFLLFLVSTNTNNTTSKDAPYPWQEKVNLITNLLSVHKSHPESIHDQPGKKPEKPFDVNRFFDILTGIRMTRGYVLDYVYARGGLGSEPILYARKSNMPRLITLNDLARYTGRHIRWPHGYFDYLEKVVVKGTLTGYFELVVLRIMGGQFYLTWHCLYNDRTILCDPRELPGLWKRVRDPMENEIVPIEIREQALGLDFTPRIEINEDTVVVQIVVFTKWGGFIQERYHLGIRYPHKFLKIESETLVPYDCGWCY